MAEEAESLRIFSGVKLLHIKKQVEKMLFIIKNMLFVRNNEYSCAVTPQVRQTGNRLSGLAGTAYASLLT